MCWKTFTVKCYSHKENKEIFITSENFNLGNFVIANQSTNNESFRPQTICNIQYKTLNVANPCPTQSHSDLHLVVKGPTIINIMLIQFA